MEEIAFFIRFTIDPVIASCNVMTLFARKNIPMRVCCVVHVGTEINFRKHRHTPRLLARSPSLTRFVSSEPHNFGP